VLFALAMDFALARARMVEEQLVPRGVADARVLDAMRSVPREAFAPDHLVALAYEDGPLPIGLGQTISQPYIVAAMIEAAEVGAGDRVLEVGAGSGYAAAVISRIAAHVYAVERHVSLADAAAERLRTLGCRNVVLRAGDGAKGWPDAAPFDAIIVSAGGARVPDALKDQLGLGGRLVMPIGRSRRLQQLIKYRRIAARQFSEEDLGAVSFVPLVAEPG
jgi:protein-L-isoaspartate(D-aspartate) O-methyltransferase